ncbi:MAG: nucleotidyltransferase family protein, partial [Pseudomonadota bacterium]|nr:nucleotidyltransferase family protein [Pseudomonadota bacterium]
MQDLKRLGEIIKRDPFRMRCLRALRALDLPQGYIGAGFVRNAIWDELHARATPTPLNDIDVIYFSGEISPPQRIASADNTLESVPQPQAYSPNSAAAKPGLKAQEQAIERELARMVPQANWQVKNQARMHVAHEHAPYQNCHDAISYWIERETCVAVRLLANDDLDILAPFG